jgi:hypothetical protein
LEEGDPSGLRVQDFLSKENLDSKVLLHIRHTEFYPNFVKVIDWSEWNQGESGGQQSPTNTNEMVVALFLHRIDLEECHNRVVFYKIDLNSPDPMASELIETIIMNYQCLGVQLAADHR